ncbi:MAG: hypothetical protein U9R72_01840, partial [Chloroflexota bacterium]|nr:hypothetical protein [Chloroflexota bacterium]
TAHFTPASATLDWSVPFTVHEDDVYFSPGAYLTYDSAPQFDRVPIYVFDGNSVELVDIVEAPTVPAAWGLLSWKGRLLLYFLADGAQHIYVLTGAPAGTSKPFTRILDTEEDLLEYSDLYSIAGELIIQVAGETAVTDGHKFLRDPATNVFTSAWLDMGHPTAVKYLSRLSAVVSGQAADLGVKIEYRTELNGTTGSWTTAAPNTDNQRHVTAHDVGARFHLLQIRVTFTDATSTDPDTRLESIAATYSHGVK